MSQEILSRTKVEVGHKNFEDQATSNQIITILKNLEKRLGITGNHDQKIEHRINTLINILNGEIQKSNFHNIKAVDALVRLIPGHFNLGWLINSPKYQMIAIRNNLQEFQVLLENRQVNDDYLKIIINRLINIINSSTFFL